jgi:hypothetical protein
MQKTIGGRVVPTDRWGSELDAALALRDSGRLDEAVSAFDALGRAADLPVRMRPKVTLLRCAILLYDMKRGGEAIADLRHVATELPTRETPSVMLFQALWGERRFREALLEVGRLLRLRSSVEYSLVSREVQHGWLAVARSRHHRHRTCVGAEVSVVLRSKMCAEREYDDLVVKASSRRFFV